MRDTLHTGSSVAVVSSNRTLPFRVFAALLAGIIALTANMAQSSIASAAGIRTTHGGLFLLFTRIINRVAPSRSFMDDWKIFAPPVSQAVFHIVTGLVMALFYAFVLEPKLPGRPFLKGVAYGTAIWFLNAFLVLPLTDEGIAGSRHINTVGLIAFALAHMSFFLVLSVLYGVLCSGSRLGVVDGQGGRPSTKKRRIAGREFADQVAK
jgi:uncharacterized membrane protein YagU involved in acid resistance